MAYSLQGMHVPSCCEFLWAQLTILTAPRIGSTRECNLVLNYPWQGLLSSSPLPLMPMKLHKTLSNELVICYVFYVKLMSFGNKPWIYMLPLMHEPPVTCTGQYNIPQHKSRTDHFVPCTQWCV